MDNPFLPSPEVQLILDALILISASGPELCVCVVSLFFLMEFPGVPKHSNQ